MESPMPRIKRIATLLALLATPVLLAQEIPLFSEELAKRVEPGSWPFTAEYSQGRKRLAFVAALHVFTEDNPTTRAIRASFDRVAPQMVILEGFPTVLGTSPQEIRHSVRRRASPDADPFARSEVAFAASLAQGRKVPFIGGALTPQEQLEAVVAKGHAREDALFATSLAMMGYELRSRTYAPGDAYEFSKAYEHVSRAVAGSTNSPPMSELQFRADYLRLIGVEALTDAQIFNRADPGPATLPQRIAADSMRVHDEHLLATIERQLAERDRVLVVYGGSHWTTLSEALERRYGKPELRLSPPAGAAP